MKLITITVGSISENVYIYYDENTKDGMIIDPGGSAVKIIEEVNRAGIKISSILLTHGHFDHIAAAEEIKEATGVKIYAHASEEELLKSPSLNISIMAMNQPIELVADVLLTEKSVVNVGNIELSVIHTPGHTSGSVCYYDKQNNLLFSGDTLFFEGFGRTDFPTGDMRLLISSIEKKLFSLPEETVVYSGHGEKTTIKHEKQNPYLNGGY